MAEDYISKRQNALRQTSHADLNQRFEAVDRAFTREWLETPDNHPVQMLWLRKDALATNELAYLGDSILRLRPVDPKWTDEVIEQIKSTDRNTRLGYTFELLGLAAFMAPGQQVAPTPSGTPGFDGVARFDDGATLMLSLKNYSESDFERQVHLKSEILKQELLSAMKAAARTGLGIRVYASKYPSPSDWDSLIAELRRTLPALFAQCDQMFTLGDVWRFQTHSLQPAGATLSPDPTSFQLLIAVPHHENEVKNMISNIDRARANAEKHARTTDESVCHALFLRLRESTSVVLCAAWADQYLRDNPSSALDAVILYQPTVAINTQENTNSIVHYVAFAGGPKFFRWRQPASGLERMIKLSFFVGLVSDKPSQLMRTDGAKLVPVQNHYLHQEGHLYVAYNVDPQGTTTINLSNPAPGITFHAVATMNNQSMILEGIFPPALEIALYK